MFVLINFKAISDAINCIILASMVLWQNIALVIQPLYNVLFKLLFFAVFGAVIVQAMSTAGFSSDVISITIPDQSGAT